MSVMQPRSPADSSASIDWEALRERIAALESALERGFAPSPEELQLILNERARALARERAPGEDSGEAIEIVEFGMAHEKYGIESAYVREVYPLEALTPLPCAPPFILGIVNIRGQILSLVDLKKFFGLPEKGLAELSSVIVLYAQTIEFGVLADSILGVRRVPLGGLQTDIPTLTGLAKEYFKGVDPEGTIVLDAAAILSDPGIVVNDAEG